MYLVLVQNLRLRVIRFLWSLLHLPPSLRPGRTMKLGQSGWVYGRKSRQWYRGSKPKALKSPPKGGSALPAVKPVGMLSPAEVVKGLESLAGRAKPEPKRYLEAWHKRYVDHWVFTIRKEAHISEWDLSQHTPVDIDLPEIRGAPKDLPLNNVAFDVEDIIRAKDKLDIRFLKRWAVRVERQRPEYKPGPLVLTSGVHQQTTKRIERRSVTGMADVWLKRIREHWNQNPGPKVCTEYQQGIVTPIWHELTKGVSVNDLHTIIREDLAKDGLEVEFPAPHLATTWRR